ncbi:NACHT domain-containing protein [Paraburkholderia aspalathi]|uniref:NACHT domain-containing protein n=1 Tax=Paraburkholderia aspalathi TaxID=1324617 RepID=UPI0038BA4665
MNREKLIEELSPFADIGAPTPKVTEKDGKLTLRMIRDARPLKVVLDASTERVQTVWGTSSSRNHASVAAMLASEVFANLRRWADAQKELLKRDAVAQKRLIPINGKTHEGIVVQGIDEADALIGKAERPNDATEILLIDGPAGIGKTNLIEQLALSRAEGYRTAARPLVLHVKSRGRVLSNIQDLMAFSLQTIRSNITYDQIPILVRHGLVIVAIDGFDELGDPNGYELAWGQLGDLVTYVRGAGTLILSGRDTFIGRNRLMRDVHALRQDIDIVTALTLNSPTPAQAKEWLKINQWTDSNFELPAISVLLEEDSFALRPVFLTLLGEHVKPKLFREKPESYLTAMLVHHMVEREAKLFGKAVETKLSSDIIESFVLNFLYETARDMADSQAEALDTNSLSWIAEAALGDGYPAELVGMVRNRANVMAFLAPDERPNYQRFINSHLMNYFLARVTIDAVSKGDVPKYLRRNLLGSEFLSIFIDVIAEVAASNPADLQKFLAHAIQFSQTHTYIDRGIRNVGALLLSALPHFKADSGRILSDLQIDEAVLRGTAAPVTLIGVVVNQADCRGADLSSVLFDDVNVISLIADDASRFPESFPLPRTITDGAGRQISDASEVEAWLNSRGRRLGDTVAQGLASERLRSHPIYKLLGKVCRIRQHWLRAEDEFVGAKIFQDPNWPTLITLLRKHELLREETRQASGRSSAFVHIRQKERILAEDRADEDLAKFYRDLAAAIA